MESPAESSRLPRRPQSGGQRPRGARETGRSWRRGRNTDKANTVWDAQLRPAVTALNHWIDVC